MSFTPSLGTLEASAANRRASTRGVFSAASYARETWMTIFGWDASDFDWPRGPMNLNAAASDGITFFTHKATEGTGTVHAHKRPSARSRDATRMRFGERERTSRS
jgi:hypothetical protein